MEFLQNIQWNKAHRWFFLDYKSMFFIALFALLFLGGQGLLYSSMETHTVEFDGTCEIEWTTDEDGAESSEAICGDHSVSVAAGHNILMLRNPGSTLSCVLKVGEYFDGRTWACEVNTPVTETDEVVE